MMHPDPRVSRTVGGSATGAELSWVRTVLALATPCITAIACAVPRTSTSTETIDPSPAADDQGELVVSPLPAGDESASARFVAFARERGPRPQPDRSDQRITLWSICPDREKDPAVRRRVLGPSPWLPEPVLDSPAILRWQVPNERREGGKGYTVRILKIDCASFEVTELLATDQAFAIGRSGDRVYLETSDGQRVLDRATGESTAQEPAIELLIAHGDRWLVEIDGQVAEFDARRGEVVERFDGIPTGEHWDAAEEVVWDGGPYAVSLGELLDEQREPIEVIDYEQWRVVYRPLGLWSLRAGSQRTLFARNQAQGGSGVAAIPVLVTIEIDGDRMRYVERRRLGGGELGEPDPERDFEWVTVDLATGEELGRELYSPGDAEHSEPGIEFPDYLRESASRSPTGSWGPLQGMAYAFLELQGVRLELPEQGAQKLDAVARSADGREVLVLHDGTFYLGDLEARTVQQWSAPAELTTCLVKLHAAEGL